MKTYIYTLTDPNTNEVRYLGKSVNPTKRFANHLTCKVKTHCRNWIISLMKNNQLPILNIIDETDSDWIWLEIYWIEQFRQWGFNLTNLTKGGEGQNGRKASEYTKKKMSDSRKGKMYLTDESKLKISIANKGKIRTDKNKDKISNSLKNYYSKNKQASKGIKRNTCNNKLKKEQVIEIRFLLKESIPVLKISKLFNISKATIQQIKEGRTWQSLGEFKIEGKVSRLKQKDLQILYELFELKTKVKDIQKVIPYCVATIAKQRKIWKTIKNYNLK